MGSVISLSSLGYVADDATDNTGAVNLAIAEANVAGFCTIVVPHGIGRVGLCDPITNSEVRFASEGASGHSVLKGTDSAGMLRYGDSASPVIAGGGFDGIGFMGNGDISQPLISVENAGEIFFNDCVVGAGIASILRATACSMVQFNNLTGRVPNIAAPLFDLRSGSGLFIVGANIYNQSFGGGGTAVDGRHFVQSKHSWNTISIRSSFVFLFDSALYCNVQSGHNVGDVAIEGNWFDEMNQSITLIAQNGSAIGNVSIRHTEMTGKKGDAVHISGPGTFTRIDISDNPIRETKRNGIGIYGSVPLGKITGNTVTQSSEPCNFTASISGSTMTVTGRTGHPGGTIEVGDVISGAGVASGTIVTALGTGRGVEGTYTITPSQTVSSRNMVTASGRYSSCYIASGSSSLTIVGNSFGTQGNILGPGMAGYGLKIDGGTNFEIQANTAKGAIADFAVTNLVTSSCDCVWLPWSPTFSSSGGGALGSVNLQAALYQRVGDTLRYSVNGIINSVGTATGFLQIALPKSAKSGVNVSFIGQGIQLGYAVTSTVGAGSNQAILVKYDSGATIVPGFFSVSGEYQVS